MIPSPWIAVVMVFATFRFTRLIGWDDLPPVVRLRAWALGEYTVRTGSSNSMMGLTGEEPDEVVGYRRPTLAHFVHCPFCLGFWNSCIVYVWWLLAPVSCMYGIAAFALGAAVGLMAKNLDP